MTILSGMKAAIRNDARSHSPTTTTRGLTTNRILPLGSKRNSNNHSRLEEAVVSYRSNSQNPEITCEWLTDAESIPQA